MQENNQLKIIENILRGRLKSLPKKKSKAVNIFLSSTFSDLHAERDYLIENIYPRLKDYCKNQYGLEFQAIDLRWGIEGSGKKSNLAFEFCMNEVERCKNDSAGPNFIAILSERYGATNLPTSIDREEYKLIKIEIMESFADDLKFNFQSEKLNLEVEDIIDHCYKIDENVTPSIYKLLDLEAIIPGFEIENREIEILDDCDKKIEQAITLSNARSSNFLDMTIGSMSKDLVKRLASSQKIMSDFGMKQDNANIENKIDQNENNFEIYKKVWRKIFKKLVFLFQSAAKLSISKNPNLEKCFEKYFRSVTESEITYGILEAKEPSKESLVFIRKIEDIENIKDNSTSKSIISKYADLKDDGQLSRKLNELKNYKLQNAYNSKKFSSIDRSMFEYSVKWSEFGISNQTHARYLKKFGDDFYSNVKKLIDLNQSDNEIDTSLNNELIQEILNHYYFCQNICSRFEDRSEIETIFEYLKDDKNLEPLIICGPSGCGKTSLIAKAAYSLFESLKINHDSCTVILRFFGTSASSSTIVQVFKSVVNQLSLAYNLPISIDEYRTYDGIQMSKVLIDRLKIIKKKQPDQKIIFFFDSIDQLNKRDYSLEWMVKDFPSNAKFVFSTLNNHGNIIENMKRITAIKEKNYIEIETLDYEKAVSIFGKLLTSSQKTLTEIQKEEIFKLFRTADLYPLYVNLVFNIAKNWSSYDKIPKDLENFTVFNKIENCIFHIFNNLENDYGKLLVSRCLFYLTSSDESGISDVELEDVLSLDDELLNHIFEYHLPPIRKFPISLWNRIKYSLKDYITQREIDGVNVNCWYHRKFLEVARLLYVDNIKSDLKDELNNNILDVFNEKWKTNPKPFMISEAIAKRNGLENLNLTAIRYTSNQPIKFSTKGIDRYNIRKINKVLSTAIRLDDSVLRSKVLLEDIFLNYEFLTAAFHNYFDLSNYLLSENTIVIDFMICFTKQIYHENDHLVLTATIIQQIMMFNSYWLNKFPHSTALQLLTRLLSFYGISESVTKFIDECDKKSPKDCALVPTFQNQVQSDAFFKVVYDFHKNIISYQSCGCIDLKSKIFLDFYLCDNSVYKFYWHQSEFELSELIDEISLPVTNDKYISLLVFQYNDENKNILNGFCVATIHQVFCFNNDGTQLSSIELNDEIMKNLILLGNQCLLIFYEQKEYFDVFNHVTGKSLKREIFNSNISHALANLPKHYASMANNLKTYFTVILEDTSVHIYEIIFEIEIKLNKIFMRKFNDKIIDCAFQSKMATAIKFNFRFIATFNEMKCCLISLKLNNELQIYGAQPSLNRVTKKDFKIVGFSLDFLFLQTSSVLLIFDLNKLKCFSMPGLYQKVEVDFLNSVNGSIYCSTENSLYSFSWNLNDDSYEYIQLLKPFEFYDEIFDMHIKMQPCIILKNGVLIAINGHAGKTAQIQQSQFDRVGYKIDNLENFFDNIVISYSKETNIISGWAILNGKICFNIDDSDYEIVKKVDMCNRSLFVYGKKNQSTSVSVYNNFKTDKNSNSYNYSKALKFDVTNCEQVITHTNEQKGEYIFLSLINSNKINLSIVVYNQKTESWISPSLKTLELSNYIPEVNSDKNKQKPIININLTSKSSNLVLIIYSTIIFINISNSCIIAEKSFENETDLSYKIESVPHTDDQIVIFNNETIYYFTQTKDSTIDFMSHTFSICFKEFKINKNLLIILTEMIGDKTELMIYDLEKVKKQKTFAEPLFRQAYQKLSNYCVTENSNYLAVHEKFGSLSLFRLKDDLKRIARIPPVNNLNCLIGTQDFIVLSIEGTRILSYLIVDPDEPHHFSKISEIRNFSNKIQISDIDLLVNSVSQIMTPFASHFLSEYNGILLEGIFKLANMSESEYNKEVSDVIKDPYSIDFNNYNDIFKALIAVLPVLRNVSPGFNAYLGAQYSEFIRREIKRGQYIELKINQFNLPANYDVTETKTDNLTSEKHSQACTVS